MFNLLKKLAIKQSRDHSSVRAKHQGPSTAEMCSANLDLPILLNISYMARPLDITLVKSA